MLRSLSLAALTLANGAPIFNASQPSRTVLQSSEQLWAPLPGAHSKGSDSETRAIKAFMGESEVHHKKPKPATGKSDMTNLSDVDGLPELVKFLSPEAQAEALAWCKETDTQSVQVLVMTEQDDSFVAALALKPTGNAMTIVRKRLAAVRELMMRDAERSSRMK